MAVLQGGTFVVTISWNPSDSRSGRSHADSSVLFSLTWIIGHMFPQKWFGGFPEVLNFIQLELSWSWFHVTTRQSFPTIAHASVAWSPSLGSPMEPNQLLAEKPNARRQRESIFCRGSAPVQLLPLPWEWDILESLRDPWLFLGSRNPGLTHRWVTASPLKWINSRP